MGEAMPRAAQQWIPLGPMVCGIPSLVLWPLFLRLTLLRGMPPFTRGLALGSVAHVSVMAALLAAGEQEAAEAAAVAFFLLGTLRCLLVKVPAVNEALMGLCGFDSSG